MFSERLAHGSNSISDGKIRIVLSEVGEDHVMGSALEQSHEVGRKLFVDFRCSCLEHDKDIVGAGNITTIIIVSLNDVAGDRIRNRNLVISVV